MFNYKIDKMKNLFVFSFFVAFMFALASCGGPSEDQMKSLDSLNNQLDKALNDLNTSIDSTHMNVDSTTVQK
jgi:hypothetical protein